MIQATKISWKSDAVNLVKKMPRVFEDGEPVDAGSFFAFFEDKEDPLEVRKCNKYIGNKSCLVHGFYAIPFRLRRGIK